MKIRRISEFQHELSFISIEENFQAFYTGFLESDLGKIYQAIPWDSLATTFGLQDSKKGPSSIFSPKGKLALMFLKHYSCCSDHRLIEQLNGNLDYQFFCDLHLGTNRLTNFKIASDIRCELSKKLTITTVQDTLFTHWKDHIKDKDSITMDATCYESYLRFPTDQKLLWECVYWSYRQLKALCRVLKIRVPRTKYRKWSRRYLDYSKMRRKTAKKRKGLTRSLLLLLDKINGALDVLEKQYKVVMTKKYYSRRSTIKKVYRQQYQIFHTGKKPQGRIVSIDKSYLRPIVRGKEIKSVEFGAKVNKFQVDGISFIEHLSFDAFHEGNRFKETIFAAQGLTKTKTKIAGADGIYATNANRKFATKNKIRNDFKRKGRASKHEKQRKALAKMITKERASRLEGSFGKEKEHYHLKKIKARTKATEILWIFFGIHTANALEIGRRMQSQAIELQKTG
jgi:hypothetical protein